MGRRRKTRQEQQADTRDRILRAAATVFARHGFDGASLGQVADQAGFTKGAVYSNFASKDDLFVSLLEIRCRESLEEIRRLVEAPGPAQDRVQEIGDRLTQRVLGDRDGTRLFLEFWAQALRNPKLRRRFLAIWGETRAGLSRLIEDGAGFAGVALPLPADQLVSVAMALYDGLALQMLADPGLVQPGTLGAALSLIVPGPMPEESARPRKGGQATPRGRQLAATAGRDGS
jgi:AcrR family transcriptional regulator